MKLRSLLVSTILLAVASIASPADGKWTGWITDSNCGAAGAHPGSADCAAKCVKEKGAKYVFVNDADKKVYVVDAQDKAAPHAGQHVVIKGSVDGDTLKLAGIETAK